MPLAEPRTPLDALSPRDALSLQRPQPRAPIGYVVNRCFGGQHLTGFGLVWLSLWMV
jgi:hypothetical protein